METKFLRSEFGVILFSSTRETITEKKIKRFSNYDDGWSYGRGLKFTSEVIEQSINTVKMFQLYGFIETNAFPGEGGEIMITAYKNDYCCEIIAYQDDRYDFIIEKDGDEIKRFEKIDAEMVRKNIKEFRDLFVWNSSESSIQNTSTQYVKNSPAWLSEIVAAKEEFRLLTIAAHGQ